MSGLRKRGEEVRKFIIEQIPEHPSDVVQVAARHFGVSRQAIQKHLRTLEAQGVVTATGATRARTYALTKTQAVEFSYSLGNLDESKVWRDDVAEALGELPSSVIDIWHYGITEIVNNAIDHSDGTKVSISIVQDAKSSVALVIDNGEGIFHRIARLLELDDPRHAVLELAKGKLTTDPARHSGEGIFFSSRMFDAFQIRSRGISFTHRFDDDDDWLIDDKHDVKGTVVRFELDNSSLRDMKAIFDEYTSGDDYGFTKTVVPVVLAEYGDDRLVSRSQAKRLLTRFERFRVIVLDFKGVESIGQAFADEVFRVFSLQHPQVELRAINTSTHVEQMIKRAISHS